MRTVSSAEAIQYAISNQKAKSAFDARLKFMEWVNFKKAMFSPEELERIGNNDERYISMAMEAWLDDAEGMSRHNLIVIFDPNVSAFTKLTKYLGLNQTITLVQLMQTLDPEFPTADKFPGASKTGKDPATHRYFQWGGCQDSIYHYITEADNLTGIWTFDGTKTTLEEALKSLNLLPIEAQAETIATK